jgi:hypothetical protein
MPHTVASFVLLLLNYTIPKMSHKLKQLCYCIAFICSVIPAHEVFAQGTSQAAIGSRTAIQDLPDANYRFCSEPPGEYNRMMGMCLIFRKNGDRVIGDFFWPYSEGGICVNGSANGNVIDGKALERQEDDESITVRLEHQGSQLSNWDRTGFLKVSDGALTETRDNGVTRGYRYTGTIVYQHALLNLNGFHRYTAGEIVPPRSCSDR